MTNPTLKPEMSLILRHPVGQTGLIREQLICTTTRNTKTSSSLLDMAFIKMKHVSEAGTLDSFISDHQPIFLIKKKMKNISKVDIAFEGRSYKH